MLSAGEHRPIALGRKEWLAQKVEDARGIFSTLCANRKELQKAQEI